MQLLVLGVFLITGLQVRIAYPIAPAIEQENRHPSGMLLQTTGATCGPTCVANLCRFFGKPVSEAEAAWSVGTSALGSTPDQLTNALHGFGFPEARYASMTLTELDRQDRLVILHVRLFNQWDRHVAVLIGLSEEYALIADPLVGVYRTPRSKLPLDWRGPVIIPGPPAFPASPTPRLSSMGRDLFPAGMTSASFPLVLDPSRIR